MGCHLLINNVIKVDGGLLLKNHSVLIPRKLFMNTCETFRMPFLKIGVVR